MSMGCMIGRAAGTFSRSTAISGNCVVFPATGSGATNGSISRRRRRAASAAGCSDRAWYGSAGVWEAAEDAVSSAEVMLVVGTSAVVYPAAGLVPLAKSAGAKVIEVNLDETPFSSMLDRSFRGRAGEILPRLIGE